MSVTDLRNVSYGLEDDDSACDDDGNWNGDDDLRMTMILDDGGLIAVIDDDFDESDVDLSDDLGEDGDNDDKWR
jgi:hypothetical protein